MVEDMDNRRKRRRKDSGTGDLADVCDDDDGVFRGQRGQVKTRGLKEIITSLFVEKQGELDRGERADDEADENEPSEATDGEQTKSSLDFQSSVREDYDGGTNCSGGSRKRKQRANAPAAEIERADRGIGGGKGVGQQQKRLWVKNRDKAWWDHCSSSEFPNEEFKKAFRMGKQTFEMICHELSSAVAKENTTLREAVPVRQRVAVCIWRLATGAPLRDVSKKFGLGISTCHKLVLEVCSAIWTVLMPKFLQWPHGDSLEKIKDEFGSMSGIPTVVGSMYTTHVPIIAPKVSMAAYFNKRLTERNQKTSYSITVQGVVDPRGMFTDVCIGWPGSMPDDQILEKSTLFQRASEGLLDDVWIVGTSGFPLMDWVLVPYTQQHLTWTQHAFNEKISEVQRVAREAFGRLKGRWCCLQKRTEVKLQDLPVVLGACCILHNICEMRNEGIDPELRHELADVETVPDVALRSVRAGKARDAIAHNLLHHNHAGTSFLS